MTLLVTEIHVPGDLRRGFILFAADQRITMPGNLPPRSMKKVFPIPHLNAGIGYFGLAQVNERVFLSGWLPNVINQSTQITSLGEFARTLCERLNQSVNKTWLGTQPSGFHISGYNSKGLPELWHISNCGMEGFIYNNMVPEYHVTEDFLRVNAVSLGFDGTNPVIPQPFVQYYVNGDVRPFHLVWRRLDEFAEGIFQFEDFRRPTSYPEYIAFAKWKMEVIASFYRSFANRRIISKPIDAFVIVPGIGIIEQGAG